MIAYKVVKCIGDCYNSARSGSVHYQVGKTTKAPKGTKLFVFRRLKDAEKFVCRHCGEKVFRCEVTKTVKLKKILKYSYSNKGLFWKNFNEGKPFIQYVDNPPEGTLGADTVKLLEEVVYKH